MVSGLFGVFPKLLDHHLSLPPFLQNKLNQQHLVAWRTMELCAFCWASMSCERVSGWEGGHVYKNNIQQNVWKNIAFQRKIVFSSDDEKIQKMCRRRILKDSTLFSPFGFESIVNSWISLKSIAFQRKNVFIRWRENTENVPKTDSERQHFVFPLRVPSR